MVAEANERPVPGLARGAGHYESFYLKACHPSEPLGLWIRHTVHKRPGADPRGSLWFTLFDGRRPSRAVKQTLADVDGRGRTSTSTSA